MTNTKNTNLWEIYISIKKKNSDMVTELESWEET